MGYASFIRHSCVGPVALRGALEKLQRHNVVQRVAEAKRELPLFARAAYALARLLYAIFVLSLYSCKSCGGNASSKWRDWESDEFFLKKMGGMGSPPV